MPRILTIAGREHDLGGGFVVRRLLPDARCRSVGPIVFMDHIGPHEFPAGQGIDVRPHPHIGLSTLTWLFDGALLHHDSLGSLQAIRPGDVNWMTAGRGIVHSERTPAAERAAGHRIEGVQTWLALPADAAECAPAFQHVPAAEVPCIERPGVRVQVIAGTAFGLHSPVRTAVPTLYASATLDAGAGLLLDASHEERAVFPLDEGLSLDGESLAVGRLHVLLDREPARLVADRRVRVMLLGGSTVGPRHLWWNFVANSRERIEQAKADWRERRFGAVPGEADIIPLPER